MYVCVIQWDCCSSCVEICYKGTVKSCCNGLRTMVCVWLVFVIWPVRIPFRTLSSDFYGLLWSYKWKRLIYVTQIWPRPFPYIYLTIHYFISSNHSMLCSQFLTMFLNKPKINMEYVSIDVCNFCLKHLFMLLALSIQGHDSSKVTKKIYFFSIFFHPIRIIISFPPFSVFFPHPTFRLSNHRNSSRVLATKVDWLFTYCNKRSWLRHYATNRMVAG
jgi:hypothetical protein